MVISLPHPKISTFYILSENSQESKVFIKLRNNDLMLRPVPSLTLLRRAGYRMAFLRQCTKIAAHRRRHFA
jgi:hypothetical protein